MATGCLRKNGLACKQVWLVMYQIRMSLTEAWEGYVANLKILYLTLAVSLSLSIRSLFPESKVIVDIVSLIVLFSNMAPIRKNTKLMITRGRNARVNLC